MLRRLIITVVLAAAVFGFVYAFSTGQSDDNGDVTLTGGANDAVEAYIPPPGALVLRQEQVGVDLVPGWTGVLLVDGVEIPADQINCAGDDCGRPLCTDAQRAGAQVRSGCRDPLDPQNRLVFTPGEGKELEELGPGEHEITALVWPPNGDRATADEVRWTFRVTA